MPVKMALTFGRELAHRQMNWKHRAVFAPAAHFPTDADDLLDPGADIVGEIPVVLCTIIVGHQDFDVSSDELGGLVAEHASRGGIDVLDNACRIDNDNGGSSGLEQTLQLRGLGSNGLARSIRH